MKIALNISKNYLVDKPLNEVYNYFDNIISSPFDNSDLSLFGNLVDNDPPKFQFMAKWYSIGRPMYADISSTKMHVILKSENDKTKIMTLIKTNPAFIFFFIFLLTIAALKLVFQIHSKENIQIVFSYLGMALMTILFDRVIKKLLVARFEKECINKL